MEKRLLLLSKDESYLITDLKKDISMKDGIIKSKDLKRKAIGSKIKTHTGKEFYIAKPTMLDILNKKVKRGAQVILPKDIGLILAYTGLRPDSFVVDVGTGSAYLSIFIANFVPNGEVVTYEKDERFYNISRKNIAVSGLGNIKIKFRDAAKGISERKVDLVTVDIQNPEKAINHAYRSLKFGGWLVVYSPTVEGVKKACKAARGLGFSELKTVENIVREWQTERTTRPETMGLMHTGFITFARKAG